MTRLLGVSAALLSLCAYGQLLGQSGDVRLSRVADVPAATGGTLVDAEGNAWAKPGPLVCSGPGSGSGRSYLDPGAYPGQLFVALDHASGGVLALVWNNGAVGAPRISLFRIHCGQNETPLGTFDLTSSSNPSNATAAFGFIDLLTAVDPQGRFCLPADTGVYCFGAGTPLTVSHVLTSSATRALLVPAGTQWSGVVPGASTAITESALRFNQLVFASDGTLYTLFDVELNDQGRVFAVRWLLERRPNGDVLVRHGPEVLARTSVGGGNAEVRKALGAVSALAVDEARGVLLAFPRSGRRLHASPALMHPRFDGLGAATFPLRGVDGGPTNAPGHLELSQRFQQSLGHPGNPTSVVMKGARDGGLHFIVPAGVYGLSWTPATIDMDEDGLTATEEQALGTSDFLEDSDGAGLRDALEVRLYASNPADPADDEGHLRWPRGELEYAYSPLIRERLDVTVQKQTWPSDFLCGAGACTDRAGTRVLSGAHLNGPFVTEDGLHALSNTSTEVRRYALPAGTFEVVKPVADLVALLPSAASGEPIPGKGTRVFMVADNRVVAFGDGPTQLVFDLADEQCRSLLGTCGPPNVGATLYENDTYSSLRTLGFDPVTDRLLVLLNGNLDQVVLGVAPGRPAVVFARGNNLPTVTFDTGAGFFPSAQLPETVTATAGGWLWTRLDGATGLLNGDLFAFDSPNIPPLPGHPGRGWDDSLFVNAAGGPTPFGLLELVPMYDEISPGDVLVLGGPGSLDVTTFLPHPTRKGPYLYRVGQRGGVDLLLGDAWNRQGYLSGMTAVRGMGVARDGRVCAAGFDGRLHELVEPDPVTRVPTQTRTYTFAAGATDCLYDGNGVLHVLIASPPGVLVVDTRTQDPAALYAITGMSVPTRFVLGADGRYRIADAAGPLACADVSTGALVTGSLSAAGLTYGKNGSLYVLKRPEGELLEVNGDAACTPGAAPTSLGVVASQLYTQAAAVNFPWVVANLAERPDGRFVVMPSRSRLTPYTSQPINEYAYLFFVDPADRSTQVVPVDFGFGAEGNALALVPGATWTDPWDRPGSGAGGGGGTGAGAGGGAGGGGAPMTPPCSCGAPGALVVLAPLWLLRRRRGAR